jgi:hypothetical protein
MCDSPCSEDRPLYSRCTVTLQSVDQCLFCRNVLKEFMVKSQLLSALRTMFESVCLMQRIGQALLVPLSMQGNTASACQWHVHYTMYVQYTLHM